MARVNVAYIAPVYVLVDTDTGEIERVTVDDENLHRLERHAHIGYLDAPVTKQDIDKALEITEDGDTEWPSWNFGW